MRKALLVLLISSGWLAMGQNQQLLYNFEDLPQSLLLNPGASPTFDFHVGVPFLSKAYLTAGTSGVTLYDIFKIDEHSTLNERVRSSLNSLGRRDFISVHQQLELLSVGWRGESGLYYSGGIYQELDAFVYIPRDLGIIALEGTEQNRVNSFEFSDLAFTAEVLNVFHFGITKQHSERWTFGVRGKLYSSALNIRSVGNEGEFESSPGGAENTYLPLVRNGDIRIRSAGLLPLADSEGTYKLVKDQITKGLFFGGSLGLGLDVGATYKFDRNWRLSASINDIGFIANFKDVENYNYWGDYRSEAVNLEYVFPDEQPLQNVDELITDLEDVFQDETSYETYISMRPVKLNAALDYGWGEDILPCDYKREPVRTRYHNYVGLHLFSVVRPKSILPAATLFYDGRIFRGLRGKVTYTVDSYSYTNIGAMLSAQLGIFNAYIAADNLLSYSNLAKAHNASVQLGVQLIFD